MKTETPTDARRVIGRQNLLNHYEGLTLRTLSRLIAKGRIPCRRAGAKILIFDLEQVDRALDRLGNPVGMSTSEPMN